MCGLRNARRSVAVLVALLGQGLQGCVGADFSRCAGGRVDALGETCSDEVYDFVQVRQVVRQVHKTKSQDSPSGKMPGQVDLEFMQPVYNNIGNRGGEGVKPGSQKAELRFAEVGPEVDLVITNTSFYNGKGEKNGLEFGTDLIAINLRSGDTTDFKFRFVKTGTDEPATLPYTYFTICDIDRNSHARDTESIVIQGVDNILHLPDFEYDDFSTGDTLHVASTHHGMGCDNPFYIDDLKEVTCKGLTVNQAKRCVMIGFKDVTEIPVTLAIAGDEKYGRDFSFGGTSPYFEALVTPMGEQGGFGSTTGFDTTSSTTFSSSSLVDFDDELSGDAGSEASAMDDPHIVNLKGESFAVNQPADYVLIRVPRDQQKPALLDLSAGIEPAHGAPCAMYMSMVTLSGEWLGERTLQVRSLRRNRPGSNNAGNATEWPFALKVVSKSSTDGSQWIPFGVFTEEDIEALPETVRIAATQRQQFGARALEGQSFNFSIGTSQDLGKRASVLVNQASHQALNVELSGLRNLGHSDIGGLLGTEKHDPSVEEVTQACKEAKAKPSNQRSERNNKITPFVPMEGNETWISSLITAAW